MKMYVFQCLRHDILLVNEIKKYDMKRRYETGYMIIYMVVRKSCNIKVSLFCRNMPIEFVVSLIHHNEFPEKLILPEVFYDDAYTGNRHLYLTGILRIRKKVELIKKTEGVIEIRGKIWKEFVAENIDEDVEVLHFIEEGDDSFYVTGYDQDGIESGGYEGVNRQYSRFQTRVTPYTHIPQVITKFLSKFCYEILTN